MSRPAPCDRPWCVGHDDDGDHIPRRGHPTLHRCNEHIHDGSLLCPSYLNHDGQGGVYCPDEMRHVGPLMRFGSDASVMPPAAANAPSRMVDNRRLDGE